MHSIHDFDEKIDNFLCVLTTCLLNSIILKTQIYFGSENLKEKLWKHLLNTQFNGLRNFA